MSLQLTLLGWSASGLRCPDHQVNLCPENSTTPYPVTLVQMPNGTGKTTTLNMLRATLSGAAREWNSQKIREFQRSGDSTQSGKFVVKLGMDDKLLTFELNLDFIQGKVAYRTSSSHGSGIRDGFLPPLEIKKFLNPEFVNLFVFDGELANRLLNPKQTRARDAIDSLFQLSLLEKAVDHFQENWERHAQNSSSKSTQGLTRRQNNLNRLKTKRDEIKRERDALQIQQSKLKLGIQDAEQDYDQALGKDQNIGTRLQTIKVQLDQAEKVVEMEVEKTREKMRDPQRLIPGLAASLITLKTNLDRLKLPTSTSKEFFEELAEAQECVCGRQMDDMTRQAVRDRAKQYLGEDEVGVLNRIKSDIADYCGGDPEQYHQDFQEQVQGLQKLIRKRDEFKTEWRSLEEERLKQGDSELEAKKQHLDKLREQLDQCNQRLEEIERSPHSKPSEDTDCLKELEFLITKAEDDVAEATHTLTLKRKTEIIRRILNQAHQQAREELRKIMIEETNQQITQLLSRDPVWLEDIQDSLKLQGRGGASVGQTLSVSYAFLASLFNRSNHQLPFIVDSPAGALDLNVRPEVARLVPQLGKQFVAFTISSERQSFVDSLHQAAQGNVQYLTLFRKTSRMDALWQNVDSNQITETVDGVMVTGKDFFERFDLDEEL
jgi:DNA sulfur modification protein DndD